MTHRNSLSLTILFALSGCGTAAPTAPTGADSAVSAADDASAGDVTPTADAPTAEPDVVGVPDAPAPVDADDRDAGGVLAMDAADATPTDLGAADDAAGAVDVAGEVDVAAQPDVVTVVDAAMRDVQCGPSRVCVAACDEGRTRCAACATSCQQRCDMTGTACSLTCGTALGTCLSACPSLSACFASCNALPANQRVACLANCGRCTDACTTTSMNCRAACDETERTCGERCEGSCASGADAGAPLSCAAAQTACVQRCPREDC